MSTKRANLGRGAMPAAARRLLPRVTIAAVRCPHPDCGSQAGYRVAKTIDNGDGSVSRYVACRQCGRRFVLTVDPAIPCTGIIVRDGA